MNPVKISADDISTSTDFTNGNPIQVRVMIKYNAEEEEYQKGKLITVFCNGRETEATIVSDPIVISEDPEKGNKILSLIIEQ